jgi:(p)ppGpp synthase/HD superfamily hydrolase
MKDNNKAQIQMLNEAIELAVQAHYSQVSRNGEPYILHPLTVMLKLETETERIVGVLHDVLEDTDYTYEDLEDAGFTDEVLYALDALTKQQDEPYMDYIARVKKNELACKVKLADLEHNMSRCILEGNTKRYLKYLSAKEEILNEQDKTKEPFLDGGISAGESV